MVFYMAVLCGEAEGVSSGIPSNCVLIKIQTTCAHLVVVMSHSLIEGRGCKELTHSLSKF